MMSTQPKAEFLGMGKQRGEGHQEGQSPARRPQGGGWA